MNLQSAVDICLWSFIKWSFPNVDVGVIIKVAFQRTVVETRKVI